MIKRFTYINIERESVNLKEKPLIIWGKSVSALELYVKLQSAHLDVIGFTDSFVTETNTIFAGLKVFTFSELESMGDIYIYISTRSNEFRRQILEKTQKLKNAMVLIEGEVWGLAQYDTNLMLSKVRQDANEIDFVRGNLKDEKSIKTFENLLSYRLSNQESLIEEVFEKEHAQYFPQNEILKPESNEVFIDAGAYDGKTSEAFSKWNNKYSKIYLMEPDALMFQVAQEYVRLKSICNITCIDRAAYSYTTKINFLNLAESGSSRIDTKGTSTIQTISIDEMLEGNIATYIKMDIEGAEMEALRGAEKTIVKYMPKLAICIYHKSDDLWKIPFYIKKTYPQYELYIRHYSLITSETVLYATI